MISLRRSVVLLAALLLSPAGARADRFWTLQLSGGSVVLSMDPPEKKGAVLLFHRYPDGVFSSLRAAEVLRVTLAQGPEKKKPRSLDGQILILGRDAEDWVPEERDHFLDRAPAPPAPASDFGYSILGPGPFRSGAPHRTVPPSSVPTGPNGYPILSPPGSPGSRPPSIGPNGFPILSPAPGPRLRSHRDGFPG